MTATYTPDESALHQAYIRERTTGTAHDRQQADDEFSRALAAIRHEAALAERRFIASEMRLWASLNRTLDQESEATLLERAAADVDALPQVDRTAPTS